MEYVKYMTIEEIEELIETKQMLKSHAIMFREPLKKKLER